MRVTEVAGASGQVSLMRCTGQDRTALVTKFTGGGGVWGSGGGGAGYQLTHHHLVHPITFPICPSNTKSGKPVSALSPFVSEPASAQKAVFLKLFDKNCKKHIVVFCF